MTDERALRRLRRRHRLTPHTVLYEGPYTKAGGLHALFEAAPSVRDDVDDLVVAAIPDGEVAPRYRDRCERLALALGHRGIVEWSVDDADRELWRAAAVGRLTRVRTRPGEAEADLRAALDIRETADSIA